MAVFKTGKRVRFHEPLVDADWGVDGGVPFFSLLVILTLGEF